jgi:tetratricopeptide (TPR) repeat protein
MGMVLVGKRQFNLALRMLQQAVSYSARAEDLATRGQSLFSMGVVFKQLEQPMMARQTFEQALDAAERDARLDLVARCLQNLAYFEVADKELARAVEYLRRALDVYAQTGNTMDQLRAYYNIGLVYADQNDFASAIRHLERAREIRNLREVDYEGDRIEDAIELVRQRQRDLGPLS